MDRTNGQGIPDNITRNKPPTIFRIPPGARAAVQTTAFQIKYLPTELKSHIKNAHPPLFPPPPPAPTKSHTPPPKPNQPHTQPHPPPPPPPPPAPPPPNLSPPHLHSHRRTPIFSHHSPKTPKKKAPFLFTNYYSTSAEKTATLIAKALPPFSQIVTYPPPIQQPTTSW